MAVEINTERFILQSINPEDQGFIYEGLSHPRVIPFYGVRFESFEATAKQMEWYQDLEQTGSGCWWKIVDRHSGQRMGACGINGYLAKHEKAEIGYWLLPEFWSRGIMLEVIPRLIVHLFSTWKLHRLEAVVEEGNEASKKLSEKLGFKFEGKLRDAEIKNGKRISLLVYGLLATDLGQS